MNKQTKMKNLFWIVLFVSTISFAQSNENFLTDFLLEEKLKSKNILSNYNQFNFSNLWTQTKNYNVLGVIGDTHQRIKIKFISIKKSTTNPNEYTVSGKSSVKGTICDFTGIITLKEIKEVEELHFGVDNEYQDRGIKSQGILIAEYDLKENKHQKHSGLFKGKLYSKWYLSSNNEITYDNIQLFTDGYYNNAFIGIWKSYKTGKEKLCNWGDFRVPNANKDFDIGAGEFSPSKKYFNNGWADYNPMDAREWWK